MGKKEYRGLPPTNPTGLGEVPYAGDFQRIDAPTGKEQPTQVPMTAPTESGRLTEFAQSVRGLVADHSNKLFGLFALVGFTVVFYSGHILDWADFWRYVASLAAVLVFYGVLSLCQMIKKNQSKNVS